MQRLFREQDIFTFVQLAFNIAKITHIARRCLRTARNTSSERTLLLLCLLTTKGHWCRADKVLHSVRLSVLCL